MTTQCLRLFCTCFPTASPLLRSQRELRQPAHVRFRSSSLGCSVAPPRGRPRGRTGPGGRARGFTVVNGTGRSRARGPGLGDRALHPRSAQKPNQQKPQTSKQTNERGPPRPPRGSSEYLSSQDSHKQAKAGNGTLLMNDSPRPKELGFPPRFRGGKRSGPGRKREDPARQGAPSRRPGSRAPQGL